MSTLHAQKFIWIMAKAKAKGITTSERAPLLKRLFVATRPWSFPAALSPLMITFALLFRESNLSPGNAVMFTIGILSLQGAANLFNSICDFQSGLDKPGTSGDRTMVDEIITRHEFPWLFTKLTVIWFLSFIATIPNDYSIRQSYLTLYGIGVLFAVFYSAGRPPLKYIGLGDMAVFMSFGPLLVLAGTLASSLDGNIAPMKEILVLTTPAAILVVGILHANNHRDLLVDMKNKARTVSVRLGDSYSRFYYIFLVISPVILSGVAGMFVRKGAILGGLVAPLSIRLIGLISNGRSAIPRDIDAETAKVMLLYGVLTSIGLVLL